MPGRDPDFCHSGVVRGLRSEIRDSLRVTGQIGVFGGLTTENVYVRNLSPSGMMAETALEFAAGTRLRVKLPGLDNLIARVVWVTDGRMGIAFEGEIDPKDIRHV